MEVVEGGRITALHGPKGCGKSTLFNVLASAADQAGAGLYVLVIERPENADHMAVLHLPRSFRDLARSITGYVAEGFEISPAEL